MKNKIMEALLTLGPMKIGSLVYVTELDRESVVSELASLINEGRVYFEQVDETFWYAEAA